MKYFEYVLSSDDFKPRVAKTIFNKRPFFAKFDTGFIRNGPLNSDPWRS
jgi:hypothetical protein